MPAEEVFHSASIQQTESIAVAVAARLRDGGVVALAGDLGAGKTVFVRGLVKAFDGEVRQVHSPTFVLLHEYALANGRRLFHLDAYRVGGADDFEAIGFDELLAATRDGHVVAVEWPGRVAGLIPADAIRVHLTATSATAREIRVAGG